MAAKTPVLPLRVLVIRLSAIGDLIMASGLIPAMHQGWPRASISWLTDEANAGLLSANPRVAEVIALPRRRWESLWRARRWRQLAEEVRAFARDLRARRFDLVLDIQGLLKSGIWAWLSGADQRVGLGSREGSQLLMTRVISRHVTSDLLGKEYRAVAGSIGLDPATFAMDIVVGPDDDRSAGLALREAGVTSPYVALAPFTTRPQKHWFDDRWVALAGEAATLGLRAVVLGGPADSEHGSAIAAGAPAGAAASLAGRTSLREAAAVIRGAKLLVGVDTGLTHLGFAMGTPTLALFGSTRPYLDPGVPGGRVLYESMDCSPCRRHPTCHGEFTCMRRHTVEKVADAIRELLGTTSVAE
jgi:heptosyltransferase-1